MGFTNVLRLGGDMFLSKSFKYFQAVNPGQNNYLRGFRKNRFAGKSMAQVSMEQRIKLFDTKSYFLHGSVGIVVFNEPGRVWMPGETSKKCHYSKGGGLYYGVFNKVMLFAVVGLSNEKTLLNRSLASALNLNF